MDNNSLIPWYAMETDTDLQEIYNRPISAAYIPEPEPEPAPKPKPESKSESKSETTSKPKTQPSHNKSYRSADVVMMELAVKARKAVTGDVPFEWPEDDVYHNLCVAWFEEQKAKGLTNLVFLCGDESMNATGKFLICCFVCWYADGRIEGFTPTQEGTEPVIKALEVKEGYQKPRFVDNAEAFKSALQAIEDYAPFEGWKQTFRSGLAIMQDERLRYMGQPDTFSIEPPYFRFLYAAQRTHLGYGMGSWFDLPMASTDGFKAITRHFSTERSRALMYAINNC